MCRSSRAWLEGPHDQPAKVRAPRDRRRPTGDVVERARAYLAAIPRPTSGALDVAVLSAACRLTRVWLALSTRKRCSGMVRRVRLDAVAQVEHAIRYGGEPIAG
jgi:hypothetical protein